MEEELSKHDAMLRETLADCDAWEGEGCRDEFCCASFLLNGSVVVETTFFPFVIH